MLLQGYTTAAESAVHAWVLCSVSNWQPSCGRLHVQSLFGPMIYMVYTRYIPVILQVQTATWPVLKIPIKFEVGTCLSYDLDCHTTDIYQSYTVIYLSYDKYIVHIIYVSGGIELMWVSLSFVAGFRQALPDPTQQDMPDDHRQDPDDAAGFELPDQHDQQELIDAFMAGMCKESQHACRCQRQQQSQGKGWYARTCCIGNLLGMDNRAIAAKKRDWYPCHMTWL
jgi:hypothetical protein